MMMMKMMMMIVYSTVMSTRDYTRSNYWIIPKLELERKKATEDYFRTISRHLSEGTEEGHPKSQQ
jgi:hypothetical protein